MLWRERDREKEKKKTGGKSNNTRNVDYFFFSFQFQLFLRSSPLNIPHSRSPCIANVFFCVQIANFDFELSHFAYISYIYSGTSKVSKKFRCLLVQLNVNEFLTFLQTAQLHICSYGTTMYWTDVVLVSRVRKARKSSGNFPIRWISHKLECSNFIFSSTTIESISLHSRTEWTS